MRNRPSVSPAAAKVGVDIRALRLSRDIKSAALAEQAGYTRRYLSYIESGRKPASLAACKAIAHALGVPLTRIVSTEYLQELLGTDDPQIVQDTLTELEPVNGSTA